MDPMFYVKKCTITNCNLIIKIGGDVRVEGVIDAIKSFNYGCRLRDLLRRVRNFGADDARAQWGMVRAQIVGGENKLLWTVRFTRMEG
jgi:hypothetical protein